MLWNLTTRCYTSLGDLGETLSGLEGHFQSVKPPSSDQWLDVSKNVTQILRMGNKGVYGLLLLLWIDG